jgi:hypothetical protein
MFRWLDLEGIGPSKFLFERETATIAFPTLVVGAAATWVVLAGKWSA